MCVSAVIYCVKSNMPYCIDAMTYCVCEVFKPRLKPCGKRSFKLMFSKLN